MAFAVDEHATVASPRGLACKLNSLVVWHTVCSTASVHLKMSPSNLHEGPMSKPESAP